MGGVDPFDKLVRGARRYAAASPRGDDRQSADSAPDDASDILHLAELVPILRRRLDVPASFSDDAMLKSLVSIAARTSDRDRWQAAFASNLGRHLHARGADMRETLTELLALLPPPRH